MRALSRFLSDVRYHWWLGHVLRVLAYPLRFCPLFVNAERRDAPVIL